VARNEAFIAAPPDRVYEVLSDPDRYGDWVVGSREIRSADTGWPAIGTSFEHASGPPVLGAVDDTTVVDTLAPVMLELHAQVRPYPGARVTLYLLPDGEGTRVVMIEDPANPALNLLIGPLGHGLIKLRNVESLRRLKDIAECPTP
jgi:polyketide cyclase/dehydrase/lipid transport protein